MIRISFQDVKQTTSAQGQVGLGTQANTPDGSTWVYVKAAEAVAANNVVVPDAAVAVDTVSSSADQQGRIIYITESGAGWTPGAFAGAYGVVDAGTGAGQVFRVENNTADTLQLYKSTALETALDVADSDITLTFPFTVDKSAVTSTVQQATGIAQIAFAEGEYGWVLKNGNGGVIAGATLVIGAGFTTGDDTEGQVIPAVTAEGPFDAQNLGFCRVANSAADLNTLVYVNI
jgi:hypothetical protein